MVKNSSTYNDSAAVGKGHCGSSSVAWSAVIAGAFTIAAISLILLLLGSGLGFAAISPFAHAGVSLTTFTVGTIIWLILTQVIASGLGGYLTGRLRSHSAGANADETYFRDTAHGFLAWALATVITAGFLSSAAASIISGGTTAVTAVTASAAAGAGYAGYNHGQKSGATVNDSINNTYNYFIDNLFRSDPVVSADNDSRGETIRILVNGMKDGKLTDSDREYLAKVVESRTSLNHTDSLKRVDEVVANINTAKEEAKKAADIARKTAMHASLYTFLSLLIAAFIASASATCGGKCRDEV